MREALPRRPMAPLRRHRHACWGFDGEESRSIEIDEFIQQGIDADEYVLAITTGERLRRLDGRGDQVVEIAADEFYGSSPGPATSAWRAAFTEMANSAKENGFLGVRIMTDVETAAGVTTRAEFLRWELNLGVLVSRYPMTVVCAVNSGSVDLDLAADVAALHDLVEGALPTPLATIRFRDDTLVLGGEVDASNAHLLDLALTEAGDEITLDLSGVEFMDLRSIHRLHDFVTGAEERGRSVALTGVPPVVERCWRLLGEL